MITNFKQFNENLLVPRNIEGRKEKLKQMNIKLLSQEVIDGDLKIDESFMDIDPKFIKIKKVKGDVWLTRGHWTEIPEWLKDVEISGNFNCSINSLETLKNCPQKIGGWFNCSYNKLISLEGCPEIIEGDFRSSNNLLTSLEGGPKIVKGMFRCGSNKLTSLEGGPKTVKGNFSCSYNKLSSLDGCPEIIEGDFYCINKPILELPDYVKLKGEFVNV